MKVSELIKELEQMPQEMTVHMSIPEDEYTAVYDEFSKPWVFMGDVRIQIGQSERVAKST